MWGNILTEVSLKFLLVSLFIFFIILGLIFFNDFIFFDEFKDLFQYFLKFTKNLNFFILWLVSLILSTLYIFYSLITVMLITFVMLVFGWFNFFFINNNIIKENYFQINNKYFFNLKYFVFIKIIFYDIQKTYSFLFIYNIIKVINNSEKNIFNIKNIIYLFINFILKKIFILITSFSYVSFKISIKICRIIISLNKFDRDNLFDLIDNIFLNICTLLNDLIINLTFNKKIIFKKNLITYNGLLNSVVAGINPNICEKFINLTNLKLKIRVFISDKTILTNVKLNNTQKLLKSHETVFFEKTPSNNDFLKLDINFKNLNLDNLMVLVNETTSKKINNIDTLFFGKGSINNTADTWITPIYYTQKNLVKIKPSLNILKNNAFAYSKTKFDNHLTNEFTDNFIKDKPIHEYSENKLKISEQFDNFDQFLQIVQPIDKQTYNLILEYKEKKFDLLNELEKNEIEFEKLGFKSLNYLLDSDVNNIIYNENARDLTIESFNTIHYE